MATNFIILAAGRGTRLGGDRPKPLTILEDGRTILEQQLGNLVEAFGEKALDSTVVVVGYRADEIRADLPRSVATVANDAYRDTNTAKSLACALGAIPTGNSALWLNGDVVFDPAILTDAKPLILADQSFVVVAEGKTADEEVKYTLSDDGTLSSISKTVVGGLGEAVGINHIGSGDLPEFLAYLHAAESHDYFEVAIEDTIRSGVRWEVVPTGDSYAVEVDFPEDLRRANSAQSMG